MTDNAFEKAFDLLLDEAAEKAAVNIGKNAEEDNSPLSERHTKAMEKIFATERKKQSRKRILRRIKTASIATAAAIFICCASMFGVEAFRIKFMNFIYDKDAPNSDIIFSDEPTETFTNKNVTLNYIPKGFRMEQKEETSKNSWFLIFKSPDKYFYVFADPINSSMSIDTENSFIENIKINGMDGILSTNDRVRILVWHDNETVYSIDGDISKEEIIKIAENMIIK